MKQQRWSRVQVDINQFEIQVTNHESYDFAKKQLDKVFQSYQPFTITISPLKNRHTRAQQNTFRQWCRIVGKHTGYDPQALHDYFCKRFIGTKKSEAFGENDEIIIGSSSLGIKEMSEFMQKIECFIAQELPEIKLPQWEKKDA